MIRGGPASGSVHDRLALLPILAGLTNKHSSSYGSSRRVFHPAATTISTAATHSSTHPSSSSTLGIP